MKVQQLLDLTGKVAVVTGGSRGLGYQIAQGLAEAGAGVVITARKEAELAEAVGRLRGEGLDVSALRCDVADVSRCPVWWRRFCSSVARSTFWSTTQAPPGAPWPRSIR